MKIHMRGFGAAALLFCLSLNAAAQDDKMQSETRSITDRLIKGGFAPAPVAAQAANPAGLSEEHNAFRASLPKLLAAAGNGFQSMRDARRGSRGAENIYKTDFVVPGSMHNRLFGTKKGVEATFACSFHFTAGAIYTQLRKRIPVVLPDFNFSDERTGFED